MSQGAREVIWIRQLLNELLLESAVREKKMLINKKISLTLTRNPDSQNCTKHIDVMYHYIRKLVENGELAIKWIFYSNLFADSLTKASPAGFFK